MKLRLIIMNFLQFAVWGAYLTLMGNYLGNAGLGANIGVFYSIQGVVCDSTFFYYTTSINIKISKNIMDFALQSTEHHQYQTVLLRHH